MKVAHSVVVTPGRCGLYETTADLVRALRKEGIDSRLIDPDPDNNPIYKTIPENDGDIPIEGLDWFNQADVIVSHSGLGSLKLDRPKIHIAHGRPKASYLGEIKGKTPVYSYSYNEGKKKAFDAVVTFWPEHVPYLAVMWNPILVYSITAPVDLEKWTPQGPSGYKFNGHAGERNIVISDAWRDDVDPFECLHAYALYNRKYPGSKLHIYARPEDPKGWSALVQKIRDEGGIGELLPWIRGLDNVYRAADLTLTANSIATRTMRESMACGCPALHVTNPDPDQIHEALKQDRREVRRKAETFFNPKDTAAEFMDLLNGVIR